MKRACVGVCIVLAMAIMGAALASSACALVPDGDQGWYWQMPQPVGGQLYAVAFPTADAVWAVGTDGVILHSTDAGATWVTQSSNTTATLTSVSFVDDQHGWVCGNQAVSGTATGVILATGDGGTTWTDKTPADLAERLTNTSFVDSEHGWIGTAKGGVLKTSDGGDTWQRLHIGVYKGRVLVDLIDGAWGWAVGNGTHVWRTTNGGAKWTSETSRFAHGLEVAQVSFYDRLHGWAVVWSSHGNVGSVLATHDGGMTWKKVLALDAEATGASVQATGVASAWVVSMGFSSIVEGWLSSGYLESASAFSLLHTVDGGAHWQTSSLASTSVPYFVASNGDSVCAVGDGILYSGDAGSTWASATSGQRYWLTDAAAVPGSGTDLWAVDLWGAVLRSTDGVRWVEQAAPMRWSSKMLIGVSFPDAQNGWLVGVSGADLWDTQGLILHTSDGGQTWSQQTSNLSGELIRVDFVDDQHGWAISDSTLSGGSGAPLALECTTDGGATWIPKYVYDDVELDAIDFLSDTVGWVAGATGQESPDRSDAMSAIFRTTDGGTTWTTLNLPGGAPAMTGLQFLDADNGWAVGIDYTGPQEAGWIVHTTDGGATWTRLANPDGCLPFAVHFTDAMHGWVGGNGVYATSDGGTTWQRVAAGDDICALAALDPQHVWAFGYGPLVSTVDAGGDTAAPSTIATHADAAWHNKPVTLTLSASDIGGSEPVSTQYSSDGGSTWQTGTSITVDAPADHSGDGGHSILYRSTDAAGNREATQVHSVMIDTLGPTCTAPKKAVVNTGKQGILCFMATDDTSGVARATVSIVDTRGHVVRSFMERANNWSSGFGIPYFWLRFTCRLEPGHYGIEVRAIDHADNHQTQVGRNSLRVVSSGAPRPHHPPWPPGLGRAGGQGSSGPRDLGLRLRGLLGPRLRSAGAALH